MNKLTLIKPTIEMKDAALAFRKVFFDYRENVLNGSELFDQIDSYEEWLTRVTCNASIHSVLPGCVYTDTYFAVRKIDQRIIGIVCLRYELNDFFQNFGHCGYSVLPSERNQGYATEILKQICRIAQKKGLKELQLSVERDNTPSIKTIQRNGGIYLRSFSYQGEEADIYYITL